MAMVDLHDTTPEVFLTELQQFEERVREGEFFDEEAREYFGQDPLDREYYQDKYGIYEDFDPDMHEGLNALGGFLMKANAYFQAGQYDVAAEAYEIIISIVDYSPDETLGIYDPLGELGEMDESFGQRYFIALKESQSTPKFYARAISYLAHHDAPYRKHMDNFMALSGGQADVQTFLEQWVDNLAQKQVPLSLYGIPYQFHLLIRFYTQANQQDKVLALQKRFRRTFIAFYEPLLAECSLAENWPMVIKYGQEVLGLLPQEELTRPYMRHFASVNTSKVRTQMAHAYQALGKPQNALEIYQPVFEQYPNFEHYALVKRLTTTINPQQGKSLTTRILAKLQSQLPQSRYFLCQVYLNEDCFDEAYALAQEKVHYHSLQTIKLVAKAHLLAGLGSKVMPNMGTLLQDLYTKIELAEEDATLFLRDHLPTQTAIDRKTAVARAENLYRHIMQLHIDNGRKTYSTAAYYCALLENIASYDGRATEFKQFYQELLGRYPRHRALKRELAAKVEMR